MKVSKSGIFLFELIVVIFLFTVSAAVCISIFAGSYSYSTDSENLTQSSLKAETVAEVFKNSKNSDAGSDAEAIADALESDGATHDVIVGEGSTGYGDFTLNVYYDKNWNNTDDLNKVYVMTIVGNCCQSYKTKEVIRADISVSDGKKSVFEMETKKYYEGDR